MLEFFTNISLTALIVTTALVFLSVIIPNFWCRYLCPYGALLGLLSFFSLGKIKRSSQNCINCKQCETVCPGKIQITKKININSLECSACLRCVQSCPQKNAIGFSLQGYPMDQKRIALVLSALFAIGIITARQTGYWQNETSVQAYRQHILSKQMPWKTPKGIDPEKMKRMIERMKKSSSG